MSTYNVAAIVPSKFGEGDRWRIKIDEDWYDAYLTAAAAHIQPGEHALEWKQSQKTGKHFIVAVDGGYRSSPGGRPAAPAPERWPDEPAASARPAGPAASASAPMWQRLGSALAGPAPSNPQKDMWIMATSILQAMIARPEPVLDIVELARIAALAGRAAARVFEGAPMDGLRQALATPADPAPMPAPKLVPKPNNPPQGLGDPSDPRNTGPDFDDDIPF